MKSLLYSLVISLLVSLPALAQNEGISFQGLARNAAGEVLVSQKISLRLSILLGSESGSVVYVETRQVTTNPQGIFALVVGDGTANSKTGNFSTIDWSTTAKFIKVEMDPNAGLNFIAMGTSKLQTVPFAFYAFGVDAENVEGILPLGSGGTGVASIADLKTSLGVDQVDNTTDANKPLSAASQAALSTKANTADVTTSLASKVDKVTGKELSTNDYTTAEKAKLAAISGTNTGDQDLSAFATRTQLETKVDKEAGKGLSTNDYTTAEKVKLAAITGNVAGPVGPAGATGPTGAIGPQGPIGLTGPAGPAGVAGATGPQGPIGLTGPAGPQGLQGLPGAAGPAGPQGLTGVAGADGAVGPQGATGPAGVAGPAGPQGQQGAAGAAGLLTSGSVSGNTPFWDGSQWVVNSSNLYNNGSNLGIGTTTPSEKLEVVGNVKTSGTLTSGAITYPNTAGTNGYYLKTDGTGTASWAAVSGDGVPYTGATGAVNLGAYDLTVNGVKVGKGLANIADNTAVGLNALNAASTSGGGNSAFGYQALQGNTTGGSSNSAFGYKALPANTSGYNNTAIGASSLLSNTTGYYNIGIGASSLVFNTEGDYNIGVGSGALQGNKLGNTNIAIGREAGFHLNSYNFSSGTGSGNIFIGYQSGISRNRGSNNTAIGNQSLYSYTVDFYDYSNTAAFGVQSGFNNKTNNNTFLGAFADVDYTINASITNATAVGYQAKVVADNSIQLGNTSVTNVKTSGTLTAGTVTYPNTHGSANQVLSTTGSGTLAWTTPASGLPTSGNTAGDMLYWNGSSWVKVPAGSNGQSLSFENGTPTWKGTFSYRNTVKTATGKIWMDRNLGASQVATSATDALAYGDLYQWGRGSDGHESRSAGEINVASTSDTPGHGDFINQSSNRWRDPTNLNLWQGVNGINNPCPVGFRLPTKAEWEAEIATWTGSGFDSPLKLPLGGHQHPTLATPWQVGGSGSYWSSTPNDGLHSWNLGLGSTSKTMGIAQQGHGFSVRCIKDY